MTNNHMIIFLLSSSLCILSASANVFVSIDCGSSETHTDKNQIVWTGDDDYVKNGESKVVQNRKFSKLYPALDTLRVFTNTRKKNCYTVEANKGERVILRAGFYYGNYDNMSSPPSFGILFDGNYWATVDSSSTLCVFYEVTYVGV